MSQCSHLRNWWWLGTARFTEVITKEIRQWINLRLVFVQVFCDIRIKVPHDLQWFIIESILSRIKHRLKTMQNKVIMQFTFTYNNTSIILIKKSKWQLPHTNNSRLPWQEELHGEHNWPSNKGKNDSENLTSWQARSIVLHSELHCPSESCSTSWTKAKVK